MSDLLLRFPKTLAVSATIYNRKTRHVKASFRKKILKNQTG
jgi:hypothetical protein